jgi:hypothetical protein
VPLRFERFKFGPATVFSRIHDDKKVPSPFDQARVMANRPCLSYREWRWYPSSGLVGFRGKLVRLARFSHVVAANQNWHCLGPQKNTNGVPPSGRRSFALAFSPEILLTVPAGAGTRAYPASAADSPAADHGLARGSAHSNGWHVRCARAARCHSPARAAGAEPGYR